MHLITKRLEPSHQVLLGTLLDATIEIVAAEVFEVGARAHHLVRGYEDAVGHGDRGPLLPLRPAIFQKRALK
jgi:hypothetical protein